MQEIPWENSALGAHKKVAISRGGPRKYIYILIFFSPEIPAFQNIIYSFFIAEQLRNTPSPLVPSVCF